jgi:hypothetical protein
MHVGDDVFVATPDLKTAAKLALEVKMSPIRAKPEKQSLGSVSGEFLRMCTRGDVTQGYFMRSVATCIMGQWVSEFRLAPSEALQSMVSAAWALCNRSRAEGIGSALLQASVCRMTGLPGRIVDELLNGTSGLNNGPMRYNGMLRTSYDITFTAEVKGGMKKEFKRLATREFLTKHASYEEIAVLEYMEASVVEAMTESSYQKSYSDVSTGVATIIKVESVVKRTRGIYNAEGIGVINFRSKKPGLL